MLGSGMGEIEKVLGETDVVLKISSWVLLCPKRWRKRDLRSVGGT